MIFISKGVKNVILKSLYLKENIFLPKPRFLKRFFPHNCPPFPQRESLN